MQQNMEAVLPLLCYRWLTWDLHWFKLAVCTVTHRSQGACCSPKHVLSVVNNNTIMEKWEKTARGWHSSKQLFKSIWLMAAIHQLELCIVCVTLTVRQILINSLFGLCYIIYNDFLWKSNHYIYSQFDFDS